MKKPFKSGDWVVSLSDPQKTVFEVAACYFDKMLKMHRFKAKRCSTIHNLNQFYEVFQSNFSRRN